MGSLLSILTVDLVEGFQGKYKKSKPYLECLNI